MIEGTVTMAELYETTQICELLRISRAKLNWIREKHPEVKPARKVGAGICLWSQETVDRIKNLVGSESHDRR